MKTIALEQSGTTRLFWVLLSALAIIVVFTFGQSDPGIAAAGVLLVIVSLGPLYFWLLGWSHGLPMWPVFSIANGVAFALALLQGARTLDAYTPGEVIVGALTMVGFVSLGTLFWLAFTSRPPKAPAKVLMIQSEHALTYLFWFVGAGILFYANDVAGFFYLPGNLMQVFRGILLALNTMGIFTLSYYLGRGLLSKAQIVMLGLGVILTAAIGMTSLMLATALVPVALALFGYMLGSNKLPWAVMSVALVCVALLHPGKWEMREKYWSPESGVGGLTLTSLPRFYAEWFGFGLSEVGGLTGITETRLKGGERESTSAFERAGSAHMLLLVQKKSPSEVPFLNGITYEPIPRLLIPRFLDSQKGISHAGNVMLTVNYGVQTLEQTATTSIFWGLVPEAFANFGYLGITGLAFVLALYYSAITRLSVGVPMTSLRFVLGLLVMAASTKADTMAVFVTTQFQAIAGLTLAAFVLMRRQPNPFAAPDFSTVSGGFNLRDRILLPKQFAPANMQDAELEPLASSGAMADVKESGSHPRDVGTGGTVRSLPIRTPKRIASWMPRRVRAAVVAAAQSAAKREEQPETGGQPEAKSEMGRRGDQIPDTSGQSSEARQRPRQLAVPYQNYRRFRG